MIERGVYHQSRVRLELLRSLGVVAQRLQGSLVVATPYDGVRDTEEHEDDREDDADDDADPATVGVAPHAVVP